MASCGIVPTIQGWTKTDGCKNQFTLYILQDITPYGAAALLTPKLPLQYIYTERQGKGTTDK